MVRNNSENNSANILKGSKNKGDWSELYVLLYLLGTRKLYAADKELNTIDDFYFPINMIMRHDEDSVKADYILKDADKVEIYLNSTLTCTMTSQEFYQEANSLYKEIIRSQGSSFDIPSAREIIQKLHLKRLAAPKTNVTDLSMDIHDLPTGINQVMGFSIKSYIGGPPTLLNASEATNFIYKVKNITDYQMEEINNINTRNKIIDRLTRIREYGGIIEYHKTCNSVFSSNLMMIDTKMEEIMSYILLDSYVNNKKDCKDLLSRIEQANPIGYPRAGFYEMKFKQFLCAKALGMDPSKPWYGEDDTKGGYIVAKSDGNVVAFHLYNRDMFKEYLFDNTVLERASTKKHNYAYLYKEDEKIYINLNLQIRFKDK